MLKHIDWKITRKSKEGADSFVLYYRWYLYSSGPYYFGVNR